MDWYVAWQVEDFVELTREQETKLEIELKKIHAWHRETELKKYISILESFKQAVKESETGLLSPKIDQVRDIWIQSTEYVTPSIVNMLKTLTPSQKQELVHNIKRLQLEHKEKWLEYDSQDNKKKLESRAERLEEYLGSLTQEQMVLLHKLEDCLVNTVHLRIKSRKTWLTKFERAIRADKVLDENEITPLFTDFKSYRSAQHQKAVSVNRALYVSFLEELLLTLTNEQKIHVEQKLSEVVDTLKALNGDFDS